MVYWGQPIGAVIAESQDQALRATEKVRIEYEELLPVLTTEDVVKLGSFIERASVRDLGDVTEGFLRSDQVLEGTVGTGAQEHVYMETIGAIGVPKREQQELRNKLLHSPRHRS